jgi:hypothetical protein
MRHTSFLISITVVALLLSACGDSQGDARLEVQQMLDNKDYDGVITKLKSTANRDYEYLSLASAYMGKAGYSLLDIVSSATDDDVNIVASLATNTSYTSTLYLDKADEYYKKVISAERCDEGNLSSSQEDICLFIGLAAISKISSTIDLIANNTSTFGDDNNNEDYKLSATTCAMQFALENMASIPQECTIQKEEDVFFSTKNSLYTPLVVTVKSDPNQTHYHYLMTQEDPTTRKRETLLTSGYCSNESFTPRVEQYTPNYYACPINEDPDLEETTTIAILQDALNSGVDSASSDEESDVTSSLDEFKCDVLNGQYNNNSCSIDITKDVSEQEIIDYLNRENGE